MKDDLVLRRVQKAKGKNKFTPPWEGPFIMAEVLKLGMYKLANMNGILPQSNTSREQNSLPTHPKDTLWGVLGKEEAGSLL